MLSVTAVPSVWLGVLSALSGIAALVLAGGYLAARTGHEQRALVMVSAATWCSAPAITFIAPAALPVMVLAIQFPSLLAIAYVGRAGLTRLIVLNVVCASLTCWTAQLAAQPALDAARWRVASAWTVTVAVAFVAGLTLLLVRSAGETLSRARAQLARQTVDVIASRSRIAQAADSARRSLERDIHDGVQQHLVVMAVTLRTARRRAVSDPRATSELLNTLAEQLQYTINEVRRVGAGIYPAALATNGLPGALMSVSARASVPTKVVADVSERYPPDIEAALFFCALEALNNASKHAGDPVAARIELRSTGQELTLLVSDDGVGFDPDGSRPGSGLTNMRDRLAVHSGTVSITSGPGRGTSVTMRVPLPM